MLKEHLNILKNAENSKDVPEVELDVIENADGLSNAETKE